MPRALVVGGGPAGLSAALTLSDLGVDVALIEKRPGLGGNAAKLYKLFPTLEEAKPAVARLAESALLAPGVGTLLRSRVASLERSGDHIVVLFEEEPAYVDWSKCDGCGACVEACPVSVPDEELFGLAKRKAIHFHAPLSLPKRPVIDASSCSRLRGGECDLCAKACPRGAIDFGQRPATGRLKCDCVILAMGFEQYDASKVSEYGYGSLADVVTGLEFEVLASRAGESGLMRPSDGARPSSVAIVTCAGSRDARHLSYCCQVGCNNAVKHALYALDTLPEAEVYILYNDMRVRGVRGEDLYALARERGAVPLRGLPSEISASNGHLSMKIMEQSTGKLYRVEADLAVLEVGLVPALPGIELAPSLGLSVPPSGFLESSPSSPLQVAEGVFAAGAALEPCSFPEACAQGVAAAVMAASYLDRRRT